MKKFIRLVKNERHEVWKLVTNSGRSPLHVSRTRLWWAAYCIVFRQYWTSAICRVVGHKMVDHLLTRGISTCPRCLHEEVI